MDNVHWLIRTQGIEEARRQAVTKLERQIVEAAYPGFAVIGHVRSVTAGLGH
jgi:hypothetical protein